MKRFYKKDDGPLEDAAEVVEEKVERAAEAVDDAADEGARKASRIAGKAAAAVSRAAHEAGDKVRDVAAKAERVDVTGKADEVGEVTREAREKAARKAEQAMEGVGRKAEELAARIRQRAQDENGVAERGARTLERGGDYLRQHDPQDVAGDLKRLVREHPAKALVAGLAVGFLAAKTLRGAR